MLTLFELCGAVIPFFETALFLALHPCLGILNRQASRSILLCQLAYMPPVYSAKICFELFSVVEFCFAFSKHCLQNGMLATKLSSSIRNLEEYIQ